MNDQAIFIGVKNHNSMQRSARNLIKCAGINDSLTNRTLVQGLNDIVRFGELLDIAEGTRCKQLFDFRSIQIVINRILGQQVIAFC